MRISFSTVKYIAGWDTYRYVLAWAGQVNFKGAYTTNAIWQQWFSPKWIAATPGNYANFLCQANFSSLTNPTLSSLKRNSSQQLASISGGYQSTSGAGTEFATDATFSPLGYTDGQWVNYLCTGFRENSDSSTDLAAFDVGSTIEYVAGYKVFQGPRATNTQAASEAVSTPFAYTILDAAVALTVSAAAVSSVSSIMF